MHHNASLTPEGRLRLCRRIEFRLAGRPRGGVDGDLERPAYVWWRRYRGQGVAGLHETNPSPRGSTSTTITGT